MVHCFEIKLKYYPIMWGLRWHYQLGIYLKFVMHQDNTNAYIIMQIDPYMG